MYNLQIWESTLGWSIALSKTFSPSNVNFVWKSTVEITVGLMITRRVESLMRRIVIMSFSAPFASQRWASKESLCSWACLVRACRNWCSPVQIEPKLLKKGLRTEQHIARPWGARKSWQMWSISSTLSATWISTSPIWTLLSCKPVKKN